MVRVDGRYLFGLSRQEFILARTMVRVGQSHYADEVFKRESFDEFTLPRTMVRVALPGSSRTTAGRVII